MSVAERAVFILDDGGTVVYRWIRSGENPDFEQLVSEVQGAVEGIADG